MLTREDRLREHVARLFARRHRGAWFRSALRVAIAELRSERR